MRVIVFVFLLGLLNCFADPVEVGVWSEGEGGDGASEVLLFAHLPEVGTKVPAVLICPGGGYGSVVMSYEGHEVGEWFAKQGVAAFVLKYRVAPHRHPAPMLDVQRAMQVVRARAGEFRVDPGRIGVMGFSAGGHLAAIAGTKFVEADEGAQDPVSRVGSRPDFMVLAYPVISMMDGLAHVGSRKNLFGGEPSAEVAESMSAEKLVTEKTPPTFLFQTDEDPVVVAEHCVAFYLALRKAKVAAELHVFREGAHGAGLGKSEGSKAWPGLLLTWLQRSGFVEAAVD